MIETTKKRTDCRVCGSTELQLLIDFGRMPLAGSFLNPGELDRERLFPLSLLKCQNCTLMQVPEVVDPTVIFGQYSYASSTTRTLSMHFERMAADLMTLGVCGNDLIVEFGCNDGVLIRPLRCLGAHAIGVDPSDVAFRASVLGDWPLVRGYFDGASAEQILSQYGVATIIVANNVFAHIDNVDETMSAVARVLRKDGWFVFEVHYQGDLLRDYQFDTVYHEHLCYYSLLSLQMLLDRFGFSIVDVMPIPIHSGSIRVTARPSGSAISASARVREMLDREKGWSVERFVEGVEDRRKSLQILVGDLHAAGRRVVGYGAAGRATILLNYCGFGPDLVKYVVDMSPLRHGRLVSGARIPVVPVEEFHARRPDYALMTAWNYESEIVAKEQSFLRAGGRFIIPLPQLRIAGCG